MSDANWPESLKVWVADCLGQMTDANRTEAQKELREVIADAFSNKKLFSTDWAAVQLQSLSPKQNIVFNTLKRKNNEHANTSTLPKKNKKSVFRQTPVVDYNDQAALNRRAQRFQLEPKFQNVHIGPSQSIQTYTPLPDEPEANPNVPNWDRFTIVGTNQELFKEYLRLTTEPKPEQIRPYEVLKKTLSELKLRWKNRTSYAWICSQFKSLRQDLTVQRIKNEFTVQAYEIHARIALESSDMVEYNQCQAALKSLYELGIPGKVAEFTAYQILLMLHGRNKSELNLFVGRLTPQQKADDAVRHALNVQRALSIGNYHALFELYMTAPYMGAYIMDHFIMRERVKSLMVISKAYLTLPLAYLQAEFAFDSMDETLEFLKSHNSAHFVDPNKPELERQLDCKEILKHIPSEFETKYRKIEIKGAI